MEKDMFLERQSYSHPQSFSRIMFSWTVRFLETVLARRVTYFIAALFF